MDERVLHLDGGPEEWLRRIARGGSLVGVPDNAAIALLAIGFAEREGDGTLSATEAGIAHLDARGIHPFGRRGRERLGRTHRALCLDK